MVNNTLVWMSASWFSLSLQSKNKYGTIAIGISLGIRLSGLVKSDRQKNRQMKTPREAAHNRGYFYTYTANQRSKHLKDKKTFLVSSLQESE